MRLKEKTIDFIKGLIIALAVIAACAAVGCACNTTRKTTVKTDTRTAVERRDTAAYNADSVRTVYLTALAEIAMSDDFEAGVVEISRDSAGQPAVLKWQKRRLSTEARAQGSRREASARQESTVTAAVSNSSAATVEKQTEKKEIKAGMSLAGFIGMSLLMTVMLYIVFVLTVDHLLPWIKTLRR